MRSETLEELQQIFDALREDFYYAHVENLESISAAKSYIGSFYYVRRVLKEQGWFWVDAVRPITIGSNVLIAHEFFIANLVEQETSND